jgi:hypothetical protein
MIRRSDNEFHDICTSSAGKALHEGRTLGPSMPLSEFPGVKTPPKYEAAFLRFMNPLLDAMREKGGQAADSDRSRPLKRDDRAHQNGMMSPVITR